MERNHWFCMQKNEWNIVQANSQSKVPLRLKITLLCSQNLYQILPNFLSTLINLNLNPLLMQMARKRGLEKEWAQTRAGTYFWIAARMAACPTAVTCEQKTTLLGFAPESSQVFWDPGDLRTPLCLLTSIHIWLLVKVYHRRWVPMWNKIFYV